MRLWNRVAEWATAPAPEWQPTSITTDEGTTHRLTLCVGCGSLVWNMEIHSDVCPGAVSTQEETG